MSQRGSYVTEYIYCEGCHTAARSVLDGDDKDLCGGPGEEYAHRVIAGTIGGPGGGAEFLEFECELAPKLSAALCHPLRVAVLSEGHGSRVYEVRPAAEIKDASDTEVVVLCWEAGRYGSRPPGVEITDPEANRLEFNGRAWVPRAKTEVTR